MDIVDKFQPLTTYFTPQEMKAIKAMAESQRKRAENNANKVNDTDRAIDYEKLTEYQERVSEAELFLMKLDGGETDLYLFLEEEDMTNLLYDEIHLRLRRSGDKKKALYQGIADKLNEIVL